MSAMGAAALGGLNRLNKAGEALGWLNPSAISILFYSILYWLRFIRPTVLAALCPPLRIGCAVFAALYWPHCVRRTVLAALYPPLRIGCAVSAALYWLRCIRRTVFMH